jgi:hypothetical protein
MPNLDILGWKQEAAGTVILPRKADGAKPCMLTLKPLDLQVNFLVTVVWSVIIQAGIQILKTEVQMNTYRKNLTMDIQLQMKQILNGFRMFSAKYAMVL